MGRKSRESRPQAARRPPQQVRIIGGRWKRTPLPVFDAEGLRPTPDRVRETVFNWLHHLLGGDWSQAACLDLFAGTGALGFEAASRGAASVQMIEKNPAAARQLNAIKVRLDAQQVTIRGGDALAAARALVTEHARFRVIFADPPYHQDWLSKVLPLCERLLAPDGLVYAEAEIALDGTIAPPWMAGWNIVRTDRAGMVFYYLLQRNSEPEFQA
jgi:16S rRNA (guanine(966)-N(2))-methyltransferase RsmD